MCFCKPGLYSDIQYSADLVYPRLDYLPEQKKTGSITSLRKKTGNGSDLPKKNPNPDPTILKHQTLKNKD